MTLRLRISFWVMATLCVLVALGSYRFIALGIDGAFLLALGAPVLDPRSYFIAHVISAPIALALGAFQFLPRMRVRSPHLHRWLGRIYAAAILVGGVSGLLMALDSFDRPVAATGFGALAILWLYFTAEAVRHARARDFVQHRRMMIRSFALTFAAVTLRIQLPFLIADGTPYLEISHILGWSCWVPNIIFAELWLRWTGTPKTA